MLVLTTQQAIIIELKLQPHRHDRLCHAKLLIMDSIIA